MAYENLVFPTEVGGPGPLDTLVLVVTATGTASSNPVKAAADLAAFNAEDSDDQVRHRRFSDIVESFSRYATPVSIESDGDQTITLKYESAGIHGDNTEGKPAWFIPGHRPNAYDVAVEVIAARADVTGLTTTVNGVSQSS